jgi:hypothetical protein
MVFENRMPRGIFGPIKDEERYGETCIIRSFLVLFTK